MTLGKVVSAPGGGVGGPEFQQVSILTSTGHLVTLQWDGTFAPAQIYYTVANCTGSAYLNDGGSPGQKIYGKSVAYSGSLNTLMAPTTVANGTSTSVSFTSAAIDNPTCGPSAGQNSGWALSAVTHAAVGLPATISAPLHFG